MASIRAIRIDTEKGVLNNISISVGATLVCRSTQSATTFFDSAMREADDALYEAKRQGKNRYFWHHQMHTQPADNDQQVAAVTH